MIVSSSNPRPFQMSMLNLKPAGGVLNTNAKAKSDAVTDG